MRLNKFVAQATGISRRSADKAILAGHIKINQKVASVGDAVTEKDIVTHSGTIVVLPKKQQTILLNKPVGYVCSRDGQGNKTVYALLPEDLHRLKPVGRLDKDSSGLLLMSDDGQLAHRLTHPKFEKSKVYQVTLAKKLNDRDKITIKNGVKLEDGLSKLTVTPLDTSNQRWEITMHEGRNRQIRRTFESLGYRVSTLRRIKFGTYTLGKLPEGNYKATTNGS